MSRYPPGAYANAIRTSIEEKLKQRNPAYKSYAPKAQITMRDEFIAYDDQGRLRKGREHGHRRLSLLSRKDLSEEVRVPAAQASFHDETLLPGRLLVKRHREASQPSQVVGRWAMAKS